MKLIIAGSRHLNQDDIYDAIVGFFYPDNKELYNSVTEIVSGTAKGADRMGELFAFNSGWNVKQFPAQWTDFSDPETVIKINKYGQKYNARAGHIRNKAMANYADALLLIWDGQSRGSKNMKENMEKLGKPIYEVIL